MSSMTHEVTSEYTRLRVRAREDPGTAGLQGEETWGRLLREWLPSGYHVATGGRMLDSQGSTSPQLDLVVLHPSYPPGLLKLKYFLAPAVVAAFECKLNLKSSHIKKSASTAAILERMAVSEGRRAGDFFYGVLAHTHSWRFPTSDPVKNVQKALVEGTAEHALFPGEALDVVCVADLASWTGHCQKNEDVLQFMHMTQVSDRDAHRKISNPDPPDPITHMLAHLFDRLRSDVAGVDRIADYLRNIGSMGTSIGKISEWRGLPKEKIPGHTFHLVWVEDEDEVMDSRECGQ
ncbi:DUF6602 domain-containing protein [Streptomyces sp. NPDC054962]